MGYNTNCIRGRAVLHQGQNCIDTVDRITVTSAGGLRRLYPDSVRLRTPVPVPPTSYQQRKRGHNSNSSGTVRKSEDDTATTASLGRCNSDMRKFVKQILPNERNWVAFACQSSSTALIINPDCLCCSHCLLVELLCCRPPSSFVVARHQSIVDSLASFFDSLWQLPSDALATSLRPPLLLTLLVGYCVVVLCQLLLMPAVIQLLMRLSPATFAIAANCQMMLPSGALLTQPPPTFSCHWMIVVSLPNVCFCWCTPLCDDAIIPGGCCCCCQSSCSTLPSGALIVIVSHQLVVAYSAKQRQQQEHQ